MDPSIKVPRTARQLAKVPAFPCSFAIFNIILITTLQKILELNLLLLEEKFPVFVIVKLRRVIMFI